LQVLDNFNEILAVLLANSIEIFIYVLLCSLAVLDPRIGHTMDVLSPFISVILIDSSTGSAVHVLMLSVQDIYGKSQFPEQTTILTTFTLKHTRNFAVVKRSFVSDDAQVLTAI